MRVLIKILSKKSIKMAAVSCKTGLTSLRLSQLNNNEISYLKLEELYHIVLSINVRHFEILTKVCNFNKLMDV